MKNSRYFSAAEFQRCVPSCSIDDMQQEFLDVLDRIREKAGIPLLLNSAYRTAAWDRAHGHVSNSAHTRGLAADIRCNSSATRMKIIKAAMDCGIRRIGIGKTFIHIDIDRSLPQDVTFHYYE